MDWTNTIFLLRGVLSLAIIGTALLGDYIVFHSKFSEVPILKAFLDNSVHSVIALLSALTFFAQDLNLSKTAIFYNVVLCTFIASFIDVDHAFLARSLWIRDMTNLKQRGFLHCTTLWIIAAVLLFAYSYVTKQLKMFLMSWMAVIAFTSHHYRDGNRRGLWIFPFGNTTPLSRPLYVILTVISPYIFATVYKRYRNRFYRERFVDYQVV